MTYLFEIIDPYSLNKQGQDVGEKYRTGIYSEKYEHLKEAEAFLRERNDYDLIVVEVLPLTNYVRSTEEHQDSLAICLNDYCHIPKETLSRYKYRRKLKGNRIDKLLKKIIT